MKKKIILRCVRGFPIGIAIGYLITILISLNRANGYYAPCVPELTSAMGSEIYAVLFQALLCGLLGAGCGGGSVIWEIESWSLVRQTGVFFLVISSFMLPVAYFAYWMEHSAAGFFFYFLGFLLIFAAIWAIQFAVAKRSVRKLNERLQSARNSPDETRK